MTSGTLSAPDRWPAVAHRLEQTLLAALANYQPWAPVYRSPRGEWVGPPRTLRQRLANELWHRLYLASKNQDGVAHIHPLVVFFAADRRAWKLTCRLYKSLSGESARTSPAQALIEVCAWLLEQAVLEKLSSRYVPAWDVRGQQATRAWTLLRQENLSSLQLASGLSPRTLFQLCTRLQAGVPLVHPICEILAHEEELRQRISASLHQATHGGERDQAWAFFGQQLSPAIGGSGPLEALLRPCLELLEQEDLPLSSGLHFEAVNLLSRLRDSRSATTLGRLVERTPPANTNVRSAALFALGNLRDPHAFPGSRGSCAPLTSSTSGAATAPRTSNPWMQRRPRQSGPWASWDSRPSKRCLCSVH